MLSHSMYSLRRKEQENGGDEEGFRGRVMDGFIESALVSEFKSCVSIFAFLSRPVVFYCDCVRI